MAHAMRVSTVIANVADETRATLDRTYPEPVGSGPPPDLPVPKVTSIVYVFCTFARPRTSKM